MKSLREPSWATRRAAPGNGSTRAPGAAIVIALLLPVLAAACSHTCPKPPPCVPPPPVVVVKAPPPCTLPALPDPIVGLGVPDAQRDGYFVPRQRWAELGGYMVGMREWIVAASACLTAGRSAP